jgi:predicted amidohydrolase
MAMATQQVLGNASRPLRVAAVQMKFARTIAGNLAAIERLLASAVSQRADAVLFPETAITGYAYDFAALKPAEVRGALAAIGRLAAAAGINVLLGAPVFRSRKLYNCLVVFDRSGRIVHCYAKCHLTAGDQRYFARGDALALFALDGVPATAVICHERRYPELVRLPVMAGARLLFHPNAGMDTLAVSKSKRGGRDGVAARAFENAIYYVFANSVGPQGRGKWSAGDSKIVAPDERVLALADNQHEAVLVAELDLAQASRTYALRALKYPKFLAGHWRELVATVQARAAERALDFDLP